MKTNCNYFQAHVPASVCWFVIGIFKSFEHMCFARTLDAQAQIVEFFVPETTTPYFLQVAQALENQGSLFNLKQLPNRLAEQIN